MRGPLAPGVPPEGERVAVRPAAPRTLRILFLVRSLDVGGAQRQLVATARGLRRLGHDVAVGVFYSGGIFEDELRSDGIAVHALGKRGRWDTAPFTVRLVRALRAHRPDLVYAYMGGANLFSALARPLMPPTTLVWGIRSAIADFRPYGWLSRLGHRLETLASPMADAVVANSEAARRAAIASGIGARRIVVIPNGIDVDRFRPDEGGRRSLRREWSIPEQAVAVGVVARLDPVKGHPVFLRAARAVATALPEARFVCVGGGSDGYRARLAALAQELGIAGALTWAGERRVTSAVYSALDVAVLSSNPGESFPNTVAEAMACGVPCVATDSGDMASIVGDAGVVVPPGDADALARAVLDVARRARTPGEDLAARARHRIATEFSIDALVRRTDEALRRAAAARAGRGAADAP